MMDVPEIETDELGAGVNHDVKHVTFSAGVANKPDPRQKRNLSMRNENEFRFETLFVSCFQFGDQLQERYCRWLTACMPAPQGNKFEQLEGILPAWYLASIQQEVPEFLSQGEHISVATRPLRRRLLLSFIIRYFLLLSLFSVLVISLFGFAASVTVILLDVLLLYMGGAGTYVRCFTWLTVTDSRKVILVRPGWVTSLSFGCIDPHGVRVFHFKAISNRIEIIEYGWDGSGSVSFPAPQHNDPTTRSISRRIVFHHIPGVRRFLRACQNDDSGASQPFNPDSSAVDQVEVVLEKQESPNPNRQSTDDIIDELFDEVDIPNDNPFATPFVSH